MIPPPKKKSHGLPPSQWSQVQTSECRVTSLTCRQGVEVSVCYSPIPACMWQCMHEQFKCMLKKNTDNTFWYKLNMCEHDVCSCVILCSYASTCTSISWCTYMDLSQDSTPKNSNVSSSSCSHQHCMTLGVNPFFGHTPIPSFCHEIPESRWSGEIW